MSSDDQRPRYLVVCPFHTPSFGSGTDLLPAAEYRRTLNEHLRWADANGIHGMVMYSFQSSLDPFACAAAMLERSERVRPVITIVPPLFHPVAAARAIASLAYMYERGIDLNMVGGASPGELERIGAMSDKARCYAQLGEYIAVLRDLLRGSCTFQGEFYRLSEVKQVPRVPEHLMPNVFVPGSSDAVAAVTRRYASASLLMAKPRSTLQHELARVSGGTAKRHAMIVGVVARDRKEDAWTIAREGQASDRRERLTSRVSVAESSSSQHKGNLELASQGEVHDESLWYGAARIGIDCPKLVGNYDEVALALRQYRALGVTDFVFDLPRDLSEYQHIARVLQRLA